jgi:hypothetical protein
MFNYFSHCSFAFVILHADALTGDKDSGVFITSLKKYTLICHWRCTGLVLHCILQAL